MPSQWKIRPPFSQQASDIRHSDIVEGDRFRQYRHVIVPYDDSDEFEGQEGQNNFKNEGTDLEDDIDLGQD